MNLTGLIIPRHHKCKEVLCPADGPWWWFGNLYSLLTDLSSMFFSAAREILLFVSHVLLSPGTLASGGETVGGSVVERILLVSKLFC